MRGLHHPVDGLSLPFSVTYMKHRFHSYQFGEPKLNLTVFVGMSAMKTVNQFLTEISAEARHMFLSLRAVG